MSPLIMSLLPIVLSPDTDPADYAERFGERLTKLGCSAEYVAAVKSDIISRAVRRGEPGDPQFRS